MFLGKKRHNQHEKRRHKSNANKSCIHRIFSFLNLLSNPWFAQFCFDIAIEDWTAKHAHVAECDRFIATEIACVTLASPFGKGRGLR